MRATRRVLVIGDIEIARLACTSLTRHGSDVTHLLRPNEDALRDVLDDDMHVVAVLVRSDVTALRYALLVEHLRPRIRLVVMLFDRTVADQLLRTVPNCQVTSPADIAVPAIIGACLGRPAGRRRRRPQLARGGLRRDRRRGHLRRLASRSPAAQVPARRHPPTPPP